MKTYNRGLKKILKVVPKEALQETQPQKCYTVMQRHTTTKSSSSSSAAEAEAGEEERKRQGVYVCCNATHQMPANRKSTAESYRSRGGITNFPPKRRTQTSCAADMPLAGRVFFRYPVPSPSLVIGQQDLGEVRNNCNICKSRTQRTKPQSGSPNHSSVQAES